MPQVKEIYEYRGDVRLMRQLARKFRAVILKDEVQDSNDNHPENCSESFH